MSFSEPLKIHRRTASVVDHEPAVEHESTIELSRADVISVQEADESDVESLPEGQRIASKNLFVWITLDTLDEPRLGDHLGDDEAADIVERTATGEFYEMKAKRTFTNCEPHHKIRAFRVERERLEGLPDDD